MREKLKSGLQRLSDFFTNVRATVHRGCNAGWNRFCKIVYGGICRLSNLLRKGYRGICEGCAALRDSKFGTAVKSFFTGLSHSRPIKALRNKMAQNNASIPKEDKPDSTPQQTAKRSVVDLVENGEITTEALEKELRRERFSHRYRGLLRSTVYALIVTAAAAALIATLLLPVLQVLPRCSATHRWMFHRRRRDAPSRSPVPQRNFLPPVPPYRIQMWPERPGSVCRSPERLLRNSTDPAHRRRVQLRLKPRAPGRQLPELPEWMSPVPAPRTRSL